MTIEQTALKEKPAATQPAMKLAVTSANTPQFVKGRRDFFKYRDLGVTKATDGWMRAQVTSAVTGMTQPTGWHYHVCEGQFVYTLKGWVELEFEDGTNCRLEAGDSGLHSRRHAAPGEPHLGRPRDPRSVGAGGYGNRPCRPAGKTDERRITSANRLQEAARSLIIRGQAGVAQWQSRSFPSF